MFEQFTSLESYQKRIDSYFEWHYHRVLQIATHFELILTSAWGCP
jgi:hypothetical protein